MIGRLFTATLLISLLSPIDAWDYRIESAIQGLRRPGIERPMQAISASCNPTSTCAGLLAIAVFGGPAGVETARLALIVLIPTNLVVEGLKRATHRTRPDGEHRRSNASFPSSHAANAFAMAVVLARRWRRLAPLMLLGASIIAFSRLYLNRHFPTDVLVGALLGVGIALGCARLWDAASRQRRSGSGT